MIFAKRLLMLAVFAPSVGAFSSTLPSWRPRLRSSPDSTAVLRLWNPSEEAEAPLPDGWTEEVDYSTGQLFYYNAADGTKTSERPVIKPHEHVVDGQGHDLEIECNPVTGDCYPV